MMYRYNIKAKISLKNEWTLKQQRTKMKNRSHQGEGTNRKGSVKEGNKVNMVDVLSI
jgi:hypothetical protein